MQPRENQYPMKNQHEIIILNRFSLLYYCVANSPATVSHSALNPGGRRLLLPGSSSGN